MAQLKTSAATLRVIGDDLVPQEITSLLGADPTLAHAKGESLIGSKTGKVRIAKFGMWQMCVSDREPADLDGQIEEIFGKLSADNTVWQMIAEKYRVDLFCGLFLGESNEGIVIHPRSLNALAERRIELQLDIYAGDVE